MIINIPTQVNTALEILADAGFEAFVVGGAVRDALMGKEAHDWDVTTSAEPQQIISAFEGFRIIETGIKHGTVTVIIDEYPIEITTYRIETGYSDNRHPDSVSFTDNVEKDLARRDFTCNAIAYNPKTGITDPFGGLADIHSKIIRCVGEPDRRFNEDGLRILRCLRFSQVLGFSIDPVTKQSVHNNVNLLENISKERIYSEIMKMLSQCSADFLLEFSDVMFFIIPELKSEKGCLQNHPRHIYDVWQHSCVAVENCPHEAVIRFAALLHDVGKPLCRFTDEKGTDHFYGHGKKGADLAYNIVKNLKAPNAVADKVKQLVEYHDFVPEKISPKTYRKYVGILGEETLESLFIIREADLRAQNPQYLEESLAGNKAGYSVYKSIFETAKCFSIKDLDISGNDLMAEGVPSSPLLGEILSQLFDEVISDKLENNKSALLSRAKEIYKWKQ